jgi:hypothetical protein
MKTVFKNGITRSIQDKDLQTYQDAGWTTSKEQVREEVIRLKPPVKSKATVTAVEEANINIKGDE